MSNAAADKSLNFLDKVKLAAIFVSLMIGIVVLTNAAQFSLDWLKQDGPAPGMHREYVNANAPVKLLKLSALNNTVYYANPGSIKSISKSGDHTKIIYINGSETQCKEEPELLAQRINNPVGTDISP